VIDNVPLTFPEMRLKISVSPSASYHEAKPVRIVSSFTITDHEYVTGRSLMGFTVIVVVADDQ
jgi:hypothetical protein